MRCIIKEDYCKRTRRRIFGCNRFTSYSISGLDPISIKLGKNHKYENLFNFLLTYNALLSMTTLFYQPTIFIIGFCILISTIVATNELKETNSEREILIDLYKSTNGNGWKTKTKWLSDSNICAWLELNAKGTWSNYHLPTMD
jgi:hypothetical protein